MKLIFAHVENFGTLKDFSLSFTEGLNAHCMENGAGKSTLIAFLKCMLFGLSDSRSRNLSENERKRYLPWQGGTFGGYLTVEHEGAEYRIVRRFGARPAEDTLAVFEEHTGAPTDALGKIPGQTVFGIDAEGFSICSIFSESGYRAQLENESIIAHLGSEDSIRGASTALDLLAEERRMYEKRGGRGMLSELEDELAAKKESREMREAEAEALPEKEQAFLSAKAALAALTEESKDAAPAEKRPTFFGAIILFAAALAAATLSVIGSSFSRLALIGLLPSFILLFFGIRAYFANIRLQKEDVNNATPSALASKKGVFEERYRACAESERAYEAARDAREEAALLAAEIELLEKKRERIQTHLSDIKKTEELLEGAQIAYREKRASLSHSFFREHLHALGLKDGEAYRLGDRFAVSFLDGSAYHAADSLSRGGKDLVSLARSLALTSAFPAAPALPLMLDDPFLSYDDERLATALSMLGTLAKDRQILYLTCSHSRMP